MPKRSRNKEEQRLWNIGQALISERQRIVDENDELHFDLIHLREQYHIDFRDIQDQVEWMDKQSIETLQRFSKDIENLKKKHRINERTNDRFWELLWNISPKHGFYTKRILGGMPIIHASKQLGYVLLITPETDIRNELVIRFIEIWQKNRLKEKDPPPQPEKIKGSKRLDWRSLWEWAMRHPQISRKEIASKLHRNYTEVKRKLGELDNQI